MNALTLHRVDGIVTVQDMGRPGHLAQGLSRGGAADRLALIEAAALLGARAPLAGLEMAGAGGVFSVDAPMRVALTGAPMAATLDGAPLRWNATHRIEPGARLRIAGAEAGVYGYLVPAGGLATPDWLGSRAAHLAIGIGAPLAAGAVLAVTPDPAPETEARVIAVSNRFQGGTARLMDGPQTGLFDAEALDAFCATAFRRGARGNRQGVQLSAGARFVAAEAAGLASDLIGPGDVQSTGDGVPYVLLAECQTVGGYPRLGTVVAEDLPLIAQAAPGTVLRFRRVGAEEAARACRDETVLLREAAARCSSLVRDPALIPDLLSYQLIGGVTRGDDLERDDAR